MVLVMIKVRIRVGGYVVYKIPYRRARAWPSGCIVQPLGRVRARAKESCIQGVMGFDSSVKAIYRTR